jgi:hypothetical protein
VEDIQQLDLLGEYSGLLFLDRLLFHHNPVLKCGVVLYLLIPSSGPKNQQAAIYYETQTGCGFSFLRLHHDDSVLINQWGNL